MIFRNTAMLAHPIADVCEISDNKQFRLFAKSGAETANRSSRSLRILSHLQPGNSCRQTIQSGRTDHNIDIVALYFTK